ncbi:hypothetical protein LIER_35930 [Lithospermum erythrorhizon]|uniref:Uncharacterized protein n=1 Tax=Lithospermum erythrorhizon TaxID=34254 RepID=A0AAV3P323_LITER
MELNLGPSSRI